MITLSIWKNIMERLMTAKGFKICYEIPVGAANLPILVCVGAGLAFSWKEYLGPATFVAAFGGHWGNLMARCVMLLFAMCVWPLVITKMAVKE